MAYMPCLMMLSFNPSYVTTAVSDWLAALRASTKKCASLGSYPTGGDASTISYSPGHSSPVATLASSPAVVSASTTVSPFLNSTLPCLSLISAPASTRKTAPVSSPSPRVLVASMFAGWGSSSRRLLFGSSPPYSSPSRL